MLIEKKLSNATNLGRYFLLAYTRCDIIFTHKGKVSYGGCTVFGVATCADMIHNVSSLGNTEVQQRIIGMIEWHYSFWLLSMRVQTMYAII